MGDFFKDASVAGIVTALVGLVLLIMPNLTNKLIVTGLGIVLLVYGVFRIIRYVRREATEAMIDHDLSIGLICAVTGLFMLIYSNVVISILPFLFGLYLVFGGAISIQTAFDVRRFHGVHWNLHLITGIIFIVAGLAAIRNPFSTASMLTRFVGICLLVEGCYMFISSRKVKKLRTEFMNRP